MASGLAAAVELLLAAREQHWRICIVGDYDADGATATALMVRGLEALGFPARIIWCPTASSTATACPRRSSIWPGRPWRRI